jgi:outer membrane protein
MPIHSRVLTWLLAGSLATLGWHGHVSAESLSDALGEAYASNPTLQAQRAQLRATDEEYVQAETGYRPSAGVSESYTYSYLDMPPTGSTSTNGTAGAVTITQPLYTGGRVARQLDAAHADILAGRAALKHTETDVLLSVIQAYVEVRRDRETLQIRDSEIQVLSHQVEQANASFAAGDGTRTDIAQAEARLAEARSQHAATQADLQAAVSTYAAVVGHTPGELTPEPPLTGLLPGDIDTAFSAAEGNNPQLAQAQLTELAASARVAEAKANNRPTIGVTGSFGYTSGAIVVDGQLLNPGASNGALSNVAPNATVAVTATIPVFTGGLNSSQVRQAAEQDSAARISVEAMRREVTRSVATAWNRLIGERERIDADQQQVKADELAYEGVTEEQKAGYRTVLDILNAEQELAASKLALVTAQYDEYLATASVLAALGTLDARALIPGAAAYDPATNYRHATRAPGGVPWSPAIGAIDRLGAP